MSFLRDYRAWLEGLVVEGLRAEAAILEAGLERRVGLGGEVELLGVGGVVCVELGGVNLGRGALVHVGLA